MMNTRRTKLSMVRDDSQSSKTSNKKCPVVLHGDHIYFAPLKGLVLNIYMYICSSEKMFKF